MAKLTEKDIQAILNLDNLGLLKEISHLTGNIYWAWDMENAEIKEELNFIIGVLRERLKSTTKEG